MAKVKVEFEFKEAISVSCAIGEYKRRLQKAKYHPNNMLTKRIHIEHIKNLETAYTKVGKAIQEA